MTRLALLALLLPVWGCGSTAAQDRPRPQRVTLSEGGKVLREWKAYEGMRWEKNTPALQFREWHTGRWVAIISPRGTVIAEPFRTHGERGRD